MNNRRQSREIVFAILFEWSFKETSTVAEILENATEAREVKLNKFTKELLNNTFDNISSINEVIEKSSTSWKLNRLSSVSLSCLRLAISEMLYFDDIPIAVTVNEALEIAKKYGTEDDPTFINGILGTVSKEIEHKKDRF